MYINQEEKAQFRKAPGVLQSAEYLSKNVPVKFLGVMISYFLTVIVPSSCSYLRCPPSSVK